MSYYLRPEWTVGTPDIVIGFVRVRETDKGPRYYARDWSGCPLRSDKFPPDNDPVFATVEEAADALLQRATDMEWTSMPEEPVEWRRIESAT